MPCCRRRGPTGGGDPRSEGGSNAGRRRGDGLDGGAGAMGPSPEEGGADGSGTHHGPGGCQPCMPVQDGAMGDRDGGEGTTATEGGVDRRGEENGGETAVIPLLIGLRWR